MRLACRQAADNTASSQCSGASGIHKEFWVMRSDVPQLSGSLTGCSDQDWELKGGMVKTEITDWLWRFQRQSVRSQPTLECPRTKVDKQLEQKTVHLSTTDYTRIFLPTSKLNNVLLSEPKENKSESSTSKHYINTPFQPTNKIKPLYEYIVQNPIPKESNKQRMCRNNDLPLRFVVITGE